MSTLRNRELRNIVFLALLSGCIYLGTAAHPPLLDDADSAHAVVSRGMLQSGDYSVLKMDGIRYLQKSPLHYWLVAWSYALLGMTAFATRLPIALSMIALTLLAYALARRYGDERAGLYAGMATATGIGFYIFTRIMIPEALYTLFFIAALYLFLRGWNEPRITRPAMAGVALFIGLAVMTRGLIGVIFPVFVIGLFLFCTGGWRRWRDLWLIQNTVIFVLVVVPWHVVAEMRSPGYLYQYIVVEHFKRAAGTRYPPDYAGVPLWIWLAAHIGWLFPWSLFAPLSLRLFPRPSTWGTLDARGQGRLLLFLWSGFILLFFSATTGSRMEYYSFGAWPALAILLGMGLAEADKQETDASRRWVSRVMAALAIVGVALGGLLASLVWRSRHVQVHGDISSLLQEQSLNTYRVSMAHFLDLTPMAFAALRLPALIAAAAFAIGLPIAYLLRRQARTMASTVAISLSMLAFFVAANIAYGDFNPQMSSYALAQVINRQLTPQDDVMICGDFDWSSSIAFYTRRRVLIFSGRYGTNLEPGAKYPDAPHVFVERDEFPQVWNSGRRIFLTVSREGYPVCSSALRMQKAWVLAESGGKLLVSNRPSNAADVPFDEWVRKQQQTSGS